MVTITCNERRPVLRLMHCAARQMLLAGGLLCFCVHGNAVAAENEPLVSVAAAHHYRVEYKGLKGRKAFAIGSYGTYGYSWGYQSSKEAAGSALKTCRKELVWWAKQTGGKGNCKLLAKDNTLLSKDPWLGSEWQKPAPGEDVPLIKGAKSVYIEVYNGPPLKGIVLHVHGCNGLGWNKFSEVWGEYFNALGYHFFAPDSFAETRPAEVCGVPAPSRVKDRETTMKLRIAQTLRTIAELKRKYPGKPIYLWGHSEGAVVVKYLEADVAGLIMSGDECDASGIRIAAPASVPVLYLFGDNDPYIEGFTVPLTNKRMQRCRNFVRNKKTKIVVVKNNKHEYWPWRPEVAKAMSEFIGAKPFSLAKFRPGEKLTLTAKQTAERALYQKNRDHKAFAVRSNGAFSWATQWDFAEDVQQFTLYDCAHADQINVFKLPTHVCSVIDVDGKEVTAP